MRAVVLSRFGGPEVLEVDVVRPPVAAPGEVVIEVHAVTVNQTLDLQVRADGASRGVRLPHILGVDPAGVISAVGEGVDPTRLGQRVAVIAQVGCGECEFCRGGRPEQCTRSRHIGVHRPGGYAGYVAVPARNAIAIPDALGFVDAAVVLRHAPTAHHLLHEIAHLQPGERVLVMGATGGLGTVGVQIAKLMGAQVIAGAGADDRVAAAIANGADLGVNYRGRNLAEAVMDLTGGTGVDVVFENISDPETWPSALASLAHGGRLVTAGAHGGGRVELDVRRLYGRRLSVLGGRGATPASIEYVLDAAAAGSLRAVVQQSFPLEAAADAHALAEAGGLTGKLVLLPQETDR